MLSLNSEVKIMKFLNTKKGFTLVEIMICVVLISILTAVAIPIYNYVSTNEKLDDCFMNRQMISFAVKEVMNGMIDNGKKQDIILMELAEPTHVTISPKNFPEGYSERKCFKLSYDELTTVTLGDIRGGYRVGISSYDIGCEQGNYLKRANLADVKFYTKLANAEIPQCKFEEDHDTEFYYYIFDDATVLCDCPECLEAFSNQ